MKSKLFLNIDEANTHIANLDGQLEKAASDLSAVQVELTSLQTEVTTHKATISTLQTEKEQLNTQMTTLKGELATAQGEATTAKAEAARVIAEAGVKGNKNTPPDDAPEASGLKGLGRAIAANAALHAAKK